MNHLDDDTLCSVALGDPLPSDERDHLAACDDCTTQVAGLQRTVAAVRSSGGQRLAHPPPNVWAAIDTEIDSDAVPRVPPQQPTRQGARPAGSVRALHKAQPAGRPSAAWLGLAAAVGILIGAGVAWSAARPSAPEPAQVPDPVTQLAAAELAELDGDEFSGRASLVQADQELDLRVEAGALDAAQGYLEVWLINEDGERMVSVGVLPAGDGQHSFPISQSLIDQGYVIVDISREAFDDAPEHSGDTLLRGSLEDA